MNEIQDLRSLLQAEFSGTAAMPGDAAYEASIAIWAKPEARPKAVLVCRNAGDAQSAVRLAAKAGVPLSVRAGGHDWAGRALCDGLVIDLTAMRGVQIAPDQSWATIGGGTRGRDLFAHTDPIGRAPVTGSMGAVGLAGLTLGGGYGSLAGRYGLASDNLIGAEVVLVDGQIVRAEAGDAELLWALRGGGGNFGVVTALDIKLHPLPSVYAGMVLFPFEQAQAVIEGAAEVSAAASDDLGLQIGIVPTPNGSLVSLAPTWIGTPADGEAQIAPLLALGTPIMADMRHRTYGESRAIFDGFLIDGRRTVIQPVWIAAMTAEIASVLIEQIARQPSPLCSVMTHQFRGAATRIEPTATAFGFRDPHMMIEIMAQVDADVADFSAEEAWARQTVGALAPFALKGAYANLLEPNDPTRSKWSFGPNGDRLSAAKRRFDPNNVFRSAIPLPS